MVIQSDRRNGRKGGRKGRAKKDHQIDPAATTKRQEDEYDTKMMMDRLPTLLYKNKLSSSLEEATCIVESVLWDYQAANNEKEEKGETMTLSNLSIQWLSLEISQYLQAPQDEIDSIFASLKSNQKEEEEDDDKDENDDDDSCDNDDWRWQETLVDEEDDDGEYIGEGECELCERKIRLTRHHLIPRSTWVKMMSRILHAMDIYSDEPDHAVQIVLDGAPSSDFNNHAVTIIDMARSYWKMWIQELVVGTAEYKQSASKIRRHIKDNLLQRTCHVCSPCHSHIHHCFDNGTLATLYPHVDLLLQDEQMIKHCKWAFKQRPGKHANG